MTRIVEVRTYTLRPGVSKEFERLFASEAAPMLERWRVDVIAFGPSLDDVNRYYLVRAFDDLDHRQRSEDAFYGSSEWREGPRERILSLIESYTDVVLGLDESTIDGLRRSRR